MVLSSILPHKHEEIDRLNRNYTRLCSWINDCCHSFSSELFRLFIFVVLVMGRECSIQKEPRDRSSSLELLVSLTNVTCPYTHLTSF